MSSNEQRRQDAQRTLEQRLARRAQRAKRQRIITLGTTIVAVVALVVGIFYFTNAGSGQASALAYADNPSRVAESGGEPNQVS